MTFRRIQENSPKRIPNFLNFRRIQEIEGDSEYIIRILGSGEKKIGSMESIRSEVRSGRGGVEVG